MQDFDIQSLRYNISVGNVAVHENQNCVQYNLGDFKDRAGLEIGYHGYYWQPEFTLARVIKIYSPSGKVMQHFHFSRLPGKGVLGLSDIHLVMPCGMSKRSTAVHTPATKHQ